MNAEVINNAITAHGQWKAKLRAGIEGGGKDLDPSTIAKDNVCEFGKWLHSTRPSPAHLQEYNNVRKLHAEFHRAAGDVAQLAKALKRSEAENQMRLGGRFFDASANLVSALMAWKKKT